MKWSQETVEVVQDTIDAVTDTEAWACTLQAKASLAAVAQSKEVKAKDAALIMARDALQLCRPEHVTRPAIKKINEVLS